MNPKSLLKSFLTLFALMFALFGNVKQADAYDFSYVLPSGQTMYYNITGANTVQLTYPNVINASWDGYYQPIGNVALTASVYHNGTNYTLVSIGSGALYHCADITAVTIPATVATIGNGAFSGCTNLTTVTINSQTFMSSGAAGVGNIRYLFGEQVKNYILGSQVTSIGWGAFSGCSRMTTVTFLGHMASIGEGAFSGCNRLTGVFAAYPGTWAGIDFHNDPHANPLNFAHRLYDYYSGNEVTYMNISSSVTAIKPCAFYGAYDLTAVVIPSSVTTIGNEAFLDCFSLTEVTFDSYVTSVGSLAFGGCSALEIVKTNNVNLWCLNNFENPQANPLSITHHLYGPNGLEITEVNLSSVPYIGSYAFYGATSITSVIIPGSVQSIGECAFGGCTSLASVSFPATSSSLSYVGSAAFVGCTGMNTVSVNDLVNWCGVEFSDDASNPIVYGQHLYSNGSEITQLTIPSTVTSIGAYAFYHASHLTSLTIPSSVTYIGINAFKHCSGLTRVDISDMTAWCRIDFEDNPLSEAHHLYLNGDLITSLNNFGNVTTIKRFAFTGCTDLTSVTIPANMSSIENYAFYGCPNLTTVTIKSAAVASRAYTYFGNTDNLVTRFGNQVTSYTFGAGVTAIGEYALRGSMMTEVIFLGSVTSVGAGAFNDCNSLTRVDISDLAAWCGVVTDDAVSLPLYYGHHLYHSGSEVTDLVIPSGVNDINHGVFCGASGLNSVTFPSSVYSIGSYAFSECTGLTYLIFNGAPPELGDQAFQNVRRSIPVYVPEEYYYDYYRWGGFTNIIRNGNITFADANVKAICVDNWDGILGDTPDGELNHAEVAAVTTLNPSGNTNSSVFKSNHNITSFNELQYFTGLTSIDPYAFYNCDNLTSVRLPDEVTSIGDAAFQYCKLTSVYFPSGLTSIGDEAFEQCNLTSVNIPSHVASIGTNPFAGCSLLTSVAVDPSNTVFDSRNGCNAIIETETNILKTGCMNTVIPDNVTAIHPKAFNHCTGLTAITLPSEATSIGDEAFAYCTGLASIVVGATTPPTAGTNAFLNVNPTVLVNVPCGTLTTYQNTSGWSTFTNYQENCGIVFADPAVKAICVASTTGWDTDHDGELNYTEAAAVTSLKRSGTSVFQNTAITSFNELKYFTGLTSIESDVFNGCTQLTSIKLPNGITSIGDHAFDGCTKLISIVIPDGVTSLGESAFGNCTGLALLTVYAATPPTLGTGVFSQVPTALRVLVPCNTKTDYQATTGWNAFANYFELCECIEFQDPGVMDICFENWDLNHDVCLSYEEAAAVTTLNPSGIPNNSVFKGNTTMSSFDELQYFTGLTSIEDYTFAGCDHLSSVTLPIGVTSIGQCAFSGCALTSVALPTWVVSIGLHAFQNCTSLTSVTLPSTLTTIGAGAFYNCSGLSSIAIPSSVTSIDANPFMGCTALTSITVDAGNPVYDSRSNCNALIKTADNQLITGCNTTVIPSSVTSIGASAFDHCTGLTSVTLPSSLTFIGGSAFYGCTGLSSITVEATTPPIVNGSTVFYGVADTIPVYVPCESLSVYPTDYGWSYFNNFVGSCFIIFADASVKAICVANWDINHDGELSYDEAAAVTDLENLFASEESITSFDELQYLTGLSTIGSSEFLGCESLVSITLPNSVTSIGDYAFDGCEALASITIPSGVTSIGMSPFSGCSALASITVEAGNTVYDSRDNCNAIIKTSNNQLVSGCKNTDIPTSVTSIAQYAFGGCNALVSLFIPSSVGTIYNYAFNDCIGLVSLTMEADNPPTISGNTFQNVPSYIHINVPCNAKATYQAAPGWSAFTNIVDPCAVIVFADQVVKDICLAHWDSNHDGNLTYGEAATVNSIGLYFRNQAFTSFNELQYFTGLRLIETFAFQGCSAMTSVTLPYGVTTIGTNAFQNCSSLTALTLPSSVTTFSGIGNPSPFLNCSALESITVAPGNPVFDSRDNCNAIIETANNKLVLGCKNTVIPNSVTSIGQYAYAGCTSLTDFTIPSSITSIGGFAFSNCTGLTSLTIPDGVTFVSFSAFSRCSGLTSLNVEAITPPSLGQSSTFQNVSLDIPVYVPCESLSLYRDPDSPWGGFANILGADCDIVFADDNVKAICVANWDTNEDGELSYAEAVAVTEIGTVFQGNTEITSFDELQYFVGLSHLESYEFTDCANLTSIILPSRITVIGEETFYECASLTSVILPSGLTIIGDEAFSVCSSLTSINLPNGLTTIGNDAFYGCSSLTSVDIPSTVTLIGSNAFYGCTGLSSIAFPDGLTNLGGEAFGNCTGLTSITIPSSVTSIGLNPFSGCTSMESIVVEAGNTVYDSRDNCNAIIKTSTNQLVSGCMNTVIPSTVTFIGASAFKNCTGLTSVTLPDGLTTIANAAFMGCSALTSITIPSQVTQIVGYAFRDCTHLASITVERATPPTLGVNAFQNVPTDIPVFVPCHAKTAYQAAAGWSAFTLYVDPCAAIVFADENVKAICVANWDTNNDGELGYDEAAAVTSLNGAFWNNYEITSFNELQYFTGLEIIDEEEFYSCESLISIILPSTITSIGDIAFQGCTSLLSIAIPSGVNSIYANPFMGCSALASIIVEAGNTVYDSRDNCNAIIATASNTLQVGCKNTVIPSTVSAIGNSAFFGCTALTSITIPSLVETIGNFAFANSGLTSLTMETTTPPTIYGNTFQNVSTDIPIYVPCGSEADYQAADYWSVFTNYVPMPIDGIICFADENVKYLCVHNSYNWDSNHDGELSYDEAAAVTYLGGVFNSENITSFDELQYFTGLTAISNGAFESCTSLTSVIIPNGVLLIDEVAFYNCTSLTSVTLSNSVTTIASEAFDFCKNLTSITIPSSVTSISGNPFTNCFALANIVVEAGNTVYDSRDNCNAIIETASNTLQVGCKNTVIPSGIISIGNSAFNGCRNLTAVTFPASLTTIGQFAFDYCNHLTSVTLPDGVTSIGKYAFEFCTALTSVTLPNGISTLSEGVFNRCSSLPTITIPSGVTNIGSSAFAYSGLTSLTVEAINPPTIYSNTFQYVSTDIPVYVPCGSLAAYQAADVWSEFTNIIQDCPMQLEYITLEEGWNWWAPTVRIVFESLETVLEGDAPLINTQDGGFARYDNDSWSGTMGNVFEPGQMYKIFFESEGTYQVIGTMVPTVTVTIKEGYNWFGYTGVTNVAIDEALGDFVPAEDDTIVDEDGNIATYTGGAWNGTTLTTLTRGKGYVYHSNDTATKTITFVSPQE